MFGTLPLALAALVATRIAWMPAVVGLVAALFTLAAVQSPIEVYRVTHPAEVGGFFAGLLQVLGGALAAVAGISASVRQYRARRNRGVAA